MRRLKLSSEITALEPSDRYWYAPSRSPRTSAAPRLSARSMTAARFASGGLDSETPPTDAQAPSPSASSTGTAAGQRVDLRKSTRLSPNSDSSGESGSLPPASAVGTGSRTVESVRKQPGIVN